MENKIIFIIALFLSLIFIRLRAGYKRRGHITLTIFLKKVTGLDIHHLYFGILYMLAASLWIYFWNINTINLILLAIGISFIIDEIIPTIFYLKTKKETFYYTEESLIISITLHIITGIIAYFTL